MKQTETEKKLRAEARDYKAAATTYHNAWTQAREHRDSIQREAAEAIDTLTRANAELAAALSGANETIARFTEALAHKAAQRDTALAMLAKVLDVPVKDPSEVR